MPAPFGRPAADPRRPQGLGAPTSTSEGDVRADGTAPGRDSSVDVVPSLSLPKGGAAMRGLGEQFQMAAFTGTGSLTIPVVTSPGRGGFGPQLALRYDSGRGNGPFGLGMSLSPASISRRTDRGMPSYADREESDDFQLTGAEDLVPVLVEAANGWERYERSEGEFVVHRYRPRVEAGFARIERWHDTVTGRKHWRITDGSNVTSYFGRTTSSCIEVPNRAGMTFKWLLDRVEDDRGNVAQYEYVQDNDDGASRWPEQAAHPGPLPQRYLKRIRYGNRVPFEGGHSSDGDPWMFEAVFDYGEHGEVMPGPNDAVVESLAVPYAPDRPWAMREDPFSTQRPGFELRTRRLCRRVLMFHRFGVLGGGPVLVASTDFTYAASPVATRLAAVNHRGYVRQPDGTYRAEAGPPMSLEYTSGTLSERFGEVDADSLRDVSPHLDGSTLRLVDLDGEGSPGLLTKHDRTWRYKRSRGGGRFAPAVTLPTIPTTAGSAVVRLSDFDGDGRLSLWSLQSTTPGAFARTTDGDWGEFRAFDQVPIGWNPNAATFVDLTGDGLSDLVVPHVGNQLTWWPSKGREGYDHPITRSQPRSMPIPDPRRPTERSLVTTADMTGDGLADVVRVANGQLSYWPNLGRGEFGDEIIMTGLEPFDYDDRMHAGRIRLADVDGTGAADLIYFDEQGARVWINASGNGFRPPVRIHGLPPAHWVAHVDVLDIEGNGVGSLVWSSSAGADGGIRYVSVFETKPYLLSKVTNGRGLETTYSYAPSTKFYREDLDAGRPWVTRLPFPVQVIEQVETVDHVTGHRTVSRYAYHHGYFDGAEREFRGFGLVEQWDAESFEDAGEQTLDVPPVYTKTWFHTGAYLGRQRISTALSQEYWTGDADAVELPDTVLPPGLRPEEAREAVRALKGTVLRQEVFSNDGSDVQGVPYTVAERNFEVRLEQPRAGQRHASLFVHEREGLSYHYERDAGDPRLQQTATLEVDAYGSATRSVAVGYPRRTPEHDEQGQTAVVISEADVAHQTDDGGPFRVGVPVEARTFELTGHSGDPTQPWSWEQLVLAVEAALEVPFEAEVAAGQQVRRLLTRQRELYYADDLLSAAPLGDPRSRALPYQSRGAAFSEGHAAAVFGANVDADMLADAGYLLDEGLWWTRSPRQVFDASSFYQPTEVIDAWGNASTITYDADGLLVTTVVDPVGNTTEAQHDYRVLAPTMVTDANGNRTAAAYDGMGQLDRTAVLGKLGETVDTLEDPTALLEYDLWAWHDHGAPVWMRTRARERHGADPGRWLDTYAYVDGHGAALMTKAPAQPGTQVYDQQLPEAVPRWVGSGRTIRNNKGLPVRQYEPFFSTTEAFEDEDALVVHGVSAVIHYDPLGRVVRTEFPDGTEARVELSPWVQRSFDGNDAIVGTAWHTERLALPANDPDRRAALLAGAHADTPSVVHLDHLGRPFLAIEHNRDADGADVFIETRSTLDVQGNVVRITDARDVVADAHTYGMLGQALYTASAEVGERWMLADVLGSPHWGTASRGFSSRTHYDAARRPARTVVTRPDGGSFTSMRIVYGEAAPNAAGQNLRGRVYRTYDGAGLLEHEAFDIDGNLARHSRRVAAAYEITPDWSSLDGIDDTAAMDAAAVLDAEAFTTEATFDAMGRPVSQTTPDASVIRFGYGDAGVLETVAANVRGAVNETTYVEDLRYNARGQRTLVVYGNGTRTTYA
ncbi:MAG: toxin, partial [Deltaproteobacteria bacterium]|nr:toxin [Deltaproteobacteria bacterium]